MSETEKDVNDITFDHSEISHGKGHSMDGRHENDHKTGRDGSSLASFDSTGKRKSFRRLVKRFAEKTSMQGVPYINNAKLWWAKVIWSVLLVVAIAAMGMHLWYLFDQYYKYPILTKIELGFQNLRFPKLTVCNTNHMHKGRLNRFDGADELKELLEALRPERLAPDQFDENYDPLAEETNNTPTGGDTQPPSGSNQPAGGAAAPPPPLGMGKKRKKRFVDNLDAFDPKKFDPRHEDEYIDYEEEEDRPDVFRANRTAQAMIEEVFTNLYMDIDKADRARLGHNITDMLLSCSFNGRLCSADMFKLHQTAEYGNCWTLDEQKFITQQPGPSGGLSLIFYLETTEYLKSITTGYGMRIEVHEASTYPYPADEGYYIPASMETDIGLRMKTITRKGDPYGKCSEGTDFTNLFKLKYTRRACQSFCEITSTIKTCGCYSPETEEIALDQNGGLKVCRGKNESRCAAGVRKEFLMKDRTCTCDNPCSEITYSKSISQRQWPTDEYGLVLLEGVCETKKAVCKAIRDLGEKRAMNNNFLKLNIYYEDLNFEDITETAEIEEAQFLSDVGGAVGLWIGLSILSLCELLQLIIELIDYGVNRGIKMNSREHRRKQKLKQQQHQQHHVNEGGTKGHRHYDEENAEIPSVFHNGFQPSGYHSADESPRFQRHKGHHDARHNKYLDNRFQNYGFK